MSSLTFKSESNLQCVGGEVDVDPLSFLSYDFNAFEDETLKLLVGTTELETYVDGDEGGDVVDSIETAERRVDDNKRRRKSSCPLLGLPASISTNSFQSLNEYTQEYFNWHEAGIVRSSEDSYFCNDLFTAPDSLELEDHQPPRRKRRVSCPSSPLSTRTSLTDYATLSTEIENGHFLVTPSEDVLIQDGQKILPNPEESFGSQDWIQGTSHSIERSAQEPKTSPDQCQLTAPLEKDQVRLLAIGVTPEESEFLSGVAVTEDRPALPGAKPSSPAASKPPNNNYLLNQDVYQQRLNSNIPVDGPNMNVHVQNAEFWKWHAQASHPPQNYDPHAGTYTYPGMRSIYSGVPAQMPPLMSNTGHRRVMHSKTTDKPRSTAPKRIYPTDIFIPKVSSTSESSQIKLLVLPKDQHHATSFSFGVLSEVEPCAFERRDKKGKRSTLPLGFPGLACRYCRGNVGRTGRYFPSTIKTMADTKKTLMSIYRHLDHCRACPMSVKEHLHQSFEKHQEERKAKDRGSQKAFFRLIWIRLHGKYLDKPSSKQNIVSELSTDSESCSSTKSNAESETVDES